MVELLAGIAAIAYFNEQALEWLVGQWKAKMGPFMVYLAAVVGLAEAFILQLNVLPVMGLQDNAILGYIITGILIGGGSNAVHKWVGKPSREI